jgi:anti-sigma regulatory factor (Ser/Thr protein kinase)
VGSLEIRVEPELGELRHVRRTLDAWLRGKGMTEPPRAAFILATHEALANAIQHSGASSLATIRATTTHEGIEIVISDHGSWKAPDQPSNEERGRGLDLIQSLVPDAAVTRSESGTTVSLNHVYGGP